MVVKYGFYSFIFLKMFVLFDLFDSMCSVGLRWVTWVRQTQRQHADKLGQGVCAMMWHRLKWELTQWFKELAWVPCIAWRCSACDSPPPA